MKIRLNNSLLFVIQAAAFALFAMQQVRLPMQSRQVIAASAAAASLNPAQGPWDLLGSFVKDMDSGLPGWKSGSALLSKVQNSCRTVSNSSPGVSAEAKGKRSQTSGKLVETALAKTRISQPSSLIIPPLTIAETALLFNPTAAECVSGILGTDPGAKSSSAQSGCAGRGPISFPSGSVLARTAWEVIPAGSVGIVTLHIFDQTFGDSGVTAAGAAVENFPGRPVDLNKPSCPSHELSEVRTDPVPIGCFYTVAITAGNVDFYQMEQGTPNPGDRIVLVGFHLIQKQADGKTWTWSTFWWQPETSNKAGSPNVFTAIYCTGPMCPGLSSRWGHYAMNFVDTQAGAKVNIPPVVNPYLDGGTENNINTDCVVCHSYAANPMVWNASSSMNFGAQGPVSQKSLDAALGKYFATPRKRTDSIWSVAMGLNLAQPAAGASTAHLVENQKHQSGPPETAISQRPAGRH